MKIVTVIGARPQFIKAGPLSIRLREQHQEIIVHTGQHYDYEMSGVFLQELSIPAPDYHLSVGSGTHGAQTGAMLTRIEEVLLAERPDAVIVYGDTNSTLAGALAAAKLYIPLAHVEAGLRSFNRLMPEEINRVLVDHLAAWLFAPSAQAVENLSAEGILRGVYEVGDIMYDATLLYSQRAERHSQILERLNLNTKEYCLATVHRAENTDVSERLRGILAGLSLLEMPVILPLHPRTQGRLSLYEIDSAIPHVCLIRPVGYLDMLMLIRHAACVLTDSGGMQKEAGYLGVPCVTLRDETEWVETVQAGWNILAGADPEQIQRAAQQQIAQERGDAPRLYGAGDTADRICNILSSANSAGPNAQTISQVAGSPV
jgi:UDP-GlcNAc3NAcA epimerase